MTDTTKKKVFFWASEDEHQALKIRAAQEKTTMREMVVEGLALRTEFDGKLFRALMQASAGERSQLEGLVKKILSKAKRRELNEPKPKEKEETA